MVFLLRDFFQSTSSFLLLPRDSSPLHLYHLFRLPAGIRILHLFYTCALQIFHKCFTKVFASLYFSLLYINNSSFVISNSSPSLVQFHYSYPSQLSFVPFFFLLPLCNCMITLLFYHCNSFYKKCQILSKLLYSISYFV